MLRLNDLTSLDRAALGQARLGSLEEDLGMSGTQFNLAISILFVGYLTMQETANAWEGCQRVTHLHTGHLGHTIEMQPFTMNNHLQPAIPIAPSWEWSEFTLQGVLNRLVIPYC